MQEDIFQEIYRRLLSAFGPQGWWPGESPFEIMVGAVLTQNTSWTNVNKAIENLKNRGMFNHGVLSTASREEIAEAIRASGCHNLKAARLKNLLRMIDEEYQGELSALLEDDIENGRANLLRVKGVGPETADAILLYGGGHPVFVVDAYTHRVFSRHGLVAEECDYQEMQDTFMGKLPLDAQMFSEYHALIVCLGKRFCKKKNPLCGECPLQGVFPRGGGD